MQSLMKLLEVLGGFALLRVVYLLFFHPLAAYPGPTLAKLTSLWRYIIYLGGKQHLSDAALHRRYGKVVRDGPDSLLVADVDTFRAIYGFQNTIEKGDFYRLTSGDDPHNPTLFGVKTESMHKERKKKLFSSAFAPVQRSQYRPTIQKHVASLMTRIQKEISSQGPVLDIVPLVDSMMFETMLEISYGSGMELSVQEQEHLGLVSSRTDMFTAIMGVCQVPWLARFCALPQVTALMRKPQYNRDGQLVGVSALVSWIEKITDSATIDTSTMSASILRNSLQVKDSASKIALDWDEIRAECFNTIFAGIGSTSAGILAILYELGAHPEWQDRILKEEIQLPPPNPSASQAAAAAAPSGVTASSPHQQQTSALQAFIKESLRLHPPFAGPFERIIGPGAETSIPNLPGPLPQGTRIWSSLYVMNRSNDVWGADAEEFCPERWFYDHGQGNGSGSTKPSGQYRGTEDMFSVFGRGSRACIGRELAWMVMETILRSIMAKYKLTCAPDALKGPCFVEMQYKELKLQCQAR